MCAEEEWMEILMSLGKFLFVHSRVVLNPRKNFLTTDVLYNQHLNTVDHRLGSFMCNVMQEHTHTTSIKVCFIKATSNPFKPPVSTLIIKKIHALHDVH